MVTSLHDYQILMTKLEHCQSQVNQAKMLLGDRPKDNIALKNLNYWSGRLNDFHKRISLIGAKPQQIRLIYSDPISDKNFAVSYYGVEEELAKVLLMIAHPNSEILSIETL